MVNVLRQITICVYSVSHKLVNENKDIPDRWVDQHTDDPHHDKDYFLKSTTERVISFLKYLNINEIFLARGPKCLSSLSSIRHNYGDYHIDESGDCIYRDVKHLELKKNKD